MAYTKWRCATRSKRCASGGCIYILYISEGICYKYDAQQSYALHYFFPFHSLHRNSHDRPQDVRRHLIPENQWHCRERGVPRRCIERYVHPEKMTRAALFSPPVFAEPKQSGKSYRCACCPLRIHVFSCFYLSAGTGKKWSLCDNVPCSSLPSCRNASFLCRHQTSFFSALFPGKFPHISRVIHVQCDPLVCVSGETSTGGRDG